MKGAAMAAVVVVVAAGLAGAARAQVVLPEPPELARRCPGCRIGPATPAPGFEKGGRVTLAPGYQGRILVVGLTIVGWNGFCILEKSCYPFRSCRANVLGVFVNLTGGDLWFQVGSRWIGIDLPALPHPDGDGWVRVPHGRTGAYYAGTWEIPCSGVPTLRAVSLSTKRAGGQTVARLEWAAACSPCAVVPLR